MAFHSFMEENMQNKRIHLVVDSTMEVLKKRLKR